MELSAIGLQFVKSTGVLLPGDSEYNCIDDDDNFDDLGFMGMTFGSLHFGRFLRPDGCEAAVFNRGG